MIEIWERILGGLELKDTAITMLGIDYEKAFNRMNHNECLSQLVRLGASQQMVDLVSSFLCQRKMQTRINGTMGPLRTISAGSPQGSILGCFLYCITTQQLGSGLVNLEEESMEEEEYDISNTEPAPLPTITSTPGRTRSLTPDPGTTSLDENESSMEHMDGHGEEGEEVLGEESDNAAEDLSLIHI